MTPCWSSRRVRKTIPKAAGWRARSSFSRFTEEVPAAIKKFRTPDGFLQTIVRLTEDWPRGREIHLFDDHNVSRLKEPLIKSREDLPALRWLLGEPGEWERQAFHERAAFLRQEGQRLGVMLDGGWSALAIQPSGWWG
jgi:hypothetical protein